MFRSLTNCLGTSNMPSSLFNYYYFTELIFRYLEYSLAGNISLEYVPYVWQSISHTVGVRTGLQFLRLNWDRIYKTYEEVYLVLSTIFHDFVGQLSTEIDLEDVSISLFFFQCLLRLWTLAISRVVLTYFSTTAHEL